MSYIVPLLIAAVSIVHVVYSTTCPADRVCPIGMGGCPNTGADSTCEVDHTAVTGIDLGGCCSLCSPSGNSFCASGLTPDPCIIQVGAGSTCVVDVANPPFGCCSPATTTTNTTTSTCVDKLNPLTGVSDCPARASLCNDSTYLAVMTDQCPRTCNRCSNSTSSTNTTGCVDLTNPATGVSDCPARSSLCTNTVYQSLMRVQCPATCGFCTGK